MRIVLNGVETNNKGAELMLYAILQEIERKFPDATVMLPSNNIRQGYDYVKTSLDFRDLPKGKFVKKIQQLRIPGLLRRLKLPYLEFTDYHRVSNVDYFIDGSGFAFSDKWINGDLPYTLWLHRLDHYFKQGTKMIFLPQAFGPVENSGTKKLIDLLSDKATIIFPREKRSYDYLVNAGVDKSKLRICTDFTSLVDGILPKNYEHLRGKVAIIPNMRMVDKGTISLTSYVSLVKLMIDTILNNGYEPYLLNHEGKEDEELCYHIKNTVEGIEVISRLTALEVKGVVGTAYLCITSRFHGLASALNCGVPCLSTSWSHKYEELYKDYGISGCILNMKDPDSVSEKISWLLNPVNNDAIRNKIRLVKPSILAETKKMWDDIWSL